MKKQANFHDLLLFVALPQLILSLGGLAIFFKSSPVLIILFLLHGVIGIGMIFYQNQAAKEQALSPTLLWIFLSAIFVLFLVGICYLLNESLPLFFAPEIPYLLLTGVCLLNLTLRLSQGITDFKFIEQLPFVLLIPIFAGGLYVGTNKSNTESLILIASMGIFCLFAVLILRYFMIVFHKNKIEESSEKISTRHKSVIIVVAVILPVICLLLNNLSLFGDRGGIFGDFSNPWFYILAVCNGLLLLLPIKKDGCSFLLFSLKTAGLIYILYFNIIFVPLLPLGILGLFFYGLGALVFVPLTILLLQLPLMITEGKILWKNNWLSCLLAVLIGITIIPAALYGTYTLDRLNLTRAKAYESNLIYEGPSVNLRRLKRALQRSEQERLLGNRRIFSLGSNEKTPLLSFFYRKIVLEDQIFPSEVSNRLSLVFFGEPLEREFGSLPSSGNATISNASTYSYFDSSLGAYATWVDLELYNAGPNNLQEFQTTFELPAGCFIRDYYLDVLGERKMGILSDRRAAGILYESIIQTPKDPGLLSFIDDGLLSLRVYPFSPYERRTTGFLVIHSQQETLQIGNHKIELQAQNPQKEVLSLNGLTFLPKHQKTTLPPLHRKPRYYFLIDTGGTSTVATHLEQVQAFCEKQGITDRILYSVNYRVQPFLERSTPSKGGYHLSLAMEKIFLQTVEGEYPVIIAVTDRMELATPFLKGHLAKRFPESPFYYHLNQDQTLMAYSFSKNLPVDTVSQPVTEQALSFNGYPVSPNKSEVIETPRVKGSSQSWYEQAFLTFHNSLYSSENSQIYESFHQKLLTKNTAFIVLETAQQEQQLKTLQEQFLNGEEGAPAVLMSDPSLILCGLTLLFVFLLKKRKPSVM